MAPRKKKVIEIIDLVNDTNPQTTAPARPSGPERKNNGDLVYQAHFIRPALRATPAPPMTTPETKSSRLQYQPHQHWVVLGLPIRPLSCPAPSRPPTPVGIWQSGLVSRRRNVPTHSRLEQWTPINRPKPAPLTAARDVQRRVTEHIHRRALSKKTEILNVHLKSRRRGSKAARKLARPSVRLRASCGVHHGPAPCPASGPVNMIPMNTFTPNNSIVPINRLLNVSSEKTPATSDQASGGGVPPSSLTPAAGKPPSQPGSQRNASSPPPKSRNFSVVVNSGPKPKIPPHMVFDGSMSDEEPAVKTPSKSASHRVLQEESPKRRARSKRTSIAKESNQASSKAPAKHVAKKRGRPFKDAAAVNEKAPVKEKVPKKPTSKYPVPKDFDSVVPVPKATYNVFICEWKGCPAELHNLETLRRHVFKIHNNKHPSGSLECLWGDCAGTPNMLDEKSKTGEDLTLRTESKLSKKAGRDLKRTTRFESESKWQDHIEHAHITPISWQMGDGPKVSILDPNEAKPTIPRWLCDENGNQVTPSIEGQPIEEGDLAELNRKRYKPTRIGLDVVYDPVMDPKLWWKMPNDSDYMMPRTKDHN